MNDGYHFTGLFITFFKLSFLFTLGLSHFWSPSKLRERDREKLNPIKNCQEVSKSHIPLNICISNFALMRNGKYELYRIIQRNYVMIQMKYSVCMYYFSNTSFLNRNQDISPKNFWTFWQRRLLKISKGTKWKTKTRTMTIHFMG